MGLDLQLGCEFVVAFCVFTLEVLHEAAAFTDLFDETTAGGVIFLVHFKMLAELLHFFAKDSDLDLRRAGVGGVGAELFDDLLLFVGLKHTGRRFLSGKDLAGKIRVKAKRSDTRDYQRGNAE